MTLWKLEVARLVRTHRWMILFGVYLFFGAVGPLTARYLGEILERFGGGVTVEIPDPRPVDGIVQYVSNASQLGLLAVVIVAAAALALDARPEVAAFLRTRVERAGVLLVPRYVVTAAAAGLALVAGTALAWVMTAALLGSLPAGSLVLGTLYGALYLAFAIAVVAAVAGYTAGQTTTVFGALAILILLPLLGLVPAVSPWMPSELLGAVSALVEGVPAGEFARSVAVTVILTAALLGVAVRRFDTREV
jgi:ABC-2 type transport system permease protein